MRKRAVENKQVIARVPAPVRASLKRITADVEELDLRTHDGLRVMGGDIVGALIAYTNSLPLAEKMKILKNGMDEVKAMIEKAEALMEKSVKEGKSDPKQTKGKPGKIANPMAGE